VVRVKRKKKREQVCRKTKRIGRHYEGSTKHLLSRGACHDTVDLEERTSRALQALTNREASVVRASSASSGACLDSHMTSNVARKVRGGRIGDDVARVAVSQWQLCRSSARGRRRRQR